MQKHSLCTDNVSIQGWCAWPTEILQIIKSKSNHFPKACKESLYSDNQVFHISNPKIYIKSNSKSCHVRKSTRSWNILQLIPLCSFIHNTCFWQDWISYMYWGTPHATQYLRNPKRLFTLFMTLSLHCLHEIDKHHLLLNPWPLGNGDLSAHCNRTQQSKLTIYLNTARKCQLGCLIIHPNLLFQKQQNQSWGSEKSKDFLWLQRWGFCLGVEHHHDYGNVLTLESVPPCLLTMNLSKQALKFAQTYLQAQELGLTQALDLGVILHWSIVTKMIPLWITTLPSHEKL